MSLRTPLFMVKGRVLRHLDPGAIGALPCYLGGLIVPPAPGRPGDWWCPHCEWLFAGEMLQGGGPARARGRSSVVRGTNGSSQRVDPYAHGELILMPIRRARPPTSSLKRCSSASFRLPHAWILSLPSPSKLTVMRRSGNIWRSSSLNTLARLRTSEALWRAPG